MVFIKNDEKTQYSAVDLPPDKAKQNLRRIYIINRLLSYKFNIDTACVELKFTDGTIVSIDCTAVENEVADTMHHRSALDYLIYNAPLEYAQLVLCGGIEDYLKNVSPGRAFSVFVFTEKSQMNFSKPIDKFPFTEYYMRYVYENRNLFDRRIEMENNIDYQLNLLNRMYKESEDIYTVVAEELKLSDTAFWLLYAISHTDKEYTQMDFCNEWFYPIQTVNSAITKLIREELVVLEVIPGTRNRKKILLTEKGKALVDKTLKRTDEVEKKAFLMFTEEEREQYLSLMQRHIENLKQGMSEAFKNR